MTPQRGSANIPIGVREQALRLREPERVPQPAEPLNYNQRLIDHMMRCTKVGCTRCV